jgi:hypothetical protein
MGTDGFMSLIVSEFPNERIFISSKIIFGTWYGLLVNGPRISSRGSEKRRPTRTPANQDQIRMVVPFPTYCPGFA